MNNTLAGVKAKGNMSAEVQEKAPEQPQEQQKAQTDKEINFARIRAQLAEERAARLEAEQKYEKAVQEVQAKKRAPEPEDDEHSDEPYVDHKRLERRISKSEKGLEERFERKAEEKANALFEKYKMEQWLNSNPDFEEVMSHADALVKQDRELEELYLSLPKGFNREKLVYKHIKAAGLHKPPQQQAPSIQQRIDQNKRAPFYQPTGVAAGPYVVAPDTNPAVQKTAYDKMQQLIKGMRTG